MPALNTAQDYGVVFAGVNQVIAPLFHEQTSASDAAFRVELFARRKEPKSMSILALCRGSTPLGFFRLHSLFHDSVPRLFDAMWHGFSVSKCPQPLVPL
jgi:hypothetical protein